MHYSTTAVVALFFEMIQPFSCSLKSLPELRLDSLKQTTFAAVLRIAPQVANDVGRPDLIYSFLSMASHHAAWTTRR